MVFFTCNACGESLKKVQVEKHLHVCRSSSCLSCIDCGKDFWGDDYKHHLKCISEDQKYGGKGFEAKANKGEVKQLQWIQKVHEVMKNPNISPKLRDILKQMSTYDNIPRKRAKFQNWMKNSLKIHDQATQEKVWQIFSEANDSSNVNSQEQQPSKMEPSPVEQNEETPEENGLSAEVEENEDADESTVKVKFNWKGTIKAVLKEAPDNEMSIKKLRKKVLAQYYSVVTEHYKSRDDVLVTFKKKINCNPKFRILKEKVKLVR
ncbi:cell growth-regulating nucleolar protein isoform X2 [Lissotriton helveticus]